MCFVNKARIEDYQVINECDCYDLQNEAKVACIPTSISRNKSPDDALSHQSHAHKTRVAFSPL